MEASQEFRAGYVALVGQPNTGKSTLLNRFLNFKLSIVTRKAQTTRKKVLGILSGENFQIVFLDTPGLIDPKYNLQQFMTKYIESAMEEADVIVYLVDASVKKHYFGRLQENLGVVSKPVILVLNKIDLVNKTDLLPLIDRYRKSHDFEAIVPVSALKNKGVNELLKELKHILPNNPPYFPPEYLTDQQERFFVSEIIREKIFEYYGEEIPYSTHVQIEEFKENRGHKDYISAVIFVEKLSQKGILIGKKGLALKRVGEEARKAIETFLDRPVFLELYVKVLPNWRKKDKKLKDLGY